MIITGLSNIDGHSPSALRAKTGGDQVESFLFEQLLSAAQSMEESGDLFSDEEIPVTDDEEDDNHDRDGKFERRDNDEKEVDDDEEEVGDDEEEVDDDEEGVDDDEEDVDDQVGEDSGGSEYDELEDESDELGEDFSEQESDELGDDFEDETDELGDDFEEEFREAIGSENLSPSCNTKTIVLEDNSSGISVHERDSDHGANPSGEELAAKTYQELKRMCKDLSLRTQGKKVDLLKRLSVYHASIEQ